MLTELNRLVKNSEAMVNQTGDDLTFRKANVAVTMSSRSAVEIKGQSPTVNPQLTSQQLVLVGEHCGELSSLFKYELCSFPPALFKSSSRPLQSKQARLG